MKFEILGQMATIWTSFVHSALSVRGESTAMFHLLLTKEVIGSMHDFIALYDSLPVTLMHDKTDFVAMYIFLPRAILSLSTAIDFDQPEKFQQNNAI